MKKPLSPNGKIYRCIAIDIGNYEYKKPT